MIIDSTIAAVVTGGASGLGEATARALAGKGGKVALFDMNGGPAEQVAAEIGGIAWMLGRSTRDLWGAEVIENVPVKALLPYLNDIIHLLLVFKLALMLPMKLLFCFIHGKFQFNEFLFFQPI